MTKPIWTDQEKDQLIQGLKIHGKDWSALAKLIPTRTVQQIVGRYSNLAKTMNKSDFESLLPNKGPSATPANVSAARVSLSPTASLTLVGDGENKKPQQNTSAKPSRRNWTEEEERLLREGLQKFGSNWEQVAKVVTTRDRNKIREHTKVLENNGDVTLETDGTVVIHHQAPTKVPRRDWTVEEDRRLCEGLQKHGTNWEEVAKVVETRDSSKVRRRTKVLENRRDVTIQADGKVTVHQVPVGRKRPSVAAKNPSTKKKRTTKGKPSKAITILGATGCTGLCLVKQALGAGYAVKALVRDPNKFTFELSMNENFTVIKGDVTDYDKLMVALVGSTDIIVCLGGRGKDATICSTAQPVIDRAVNDMDPNMRMVVITSMAAGDSYYDSSWMARRFADWVLASAIKDKNLQERSVVKDTNNWVIVRPVGLSNGPKTGTAQGGAHVAPSASKTIARADVADFILTRCLSGNDTWKRNPVTVFPPQKM